MSGVDFVWLGCLVLAAVAASIGAAGASMDRVEAYVRRFWQPAARVVSNGRTSKATSAMFANEPLGSRRMVAAAIGGLVLLWISVIGTVLLATAWLGLRLIAARRRAAALSRDIVRELPEVVDLFAVALNSGHNVASATSVVSSRGDGPVSVALRECVALASRGQPLEEVLSNVAHELGGPDAAVRPLIAALVASERHGVPVAQSLGRLAEDVRVERRRTAERAARRLPVTMLFPLVFCVLPAFGLLTVVPVLIDALRSFSV